MPTPRLYNYPYHPASPDNEYTARVIGAASTGLTAAHRMATEGRVAGPTRYDRRVSFGREYLDWPKDTDAIYVYGQSKHIMPPMKEAAGGRNDNVDCYE